MKKRMPRRMRGGKRPKPQNPLTDPLHLVAEQGNVDAQFMLGNFCLLNEDWKEAIRWYRMAALQGYGAAQLALAAIYENGKGVPKNPKEAFGWYLKAAEQGLEMAQHNLAVCYATGAGTEKDDKLAAYWYLKAAEQGLVNSQREIADRYEFGEGVEQDWQQAVKWYQKAAEQGDEIAQCRLGTCYALGNGVEQDWQQAASWYSEAAKQGVSQAQAKLAGCFSDGKGVEQDWEKAVYWFREAARQECAPAEYMLGVLSLVNNGEDEAEDTDFWEKRGNTDATAIELDLSYQNLRKEIPYDPEQGIRWLEKSAEHEFPSAQVLLGHCLEEGLGTEQNLEKALRWYERAAAAGEEQAAERLVELRSEKPECFSERT